MLQLKQFYFLIAIVVFFIAIGKNRKIQEQFNGNNPRVNTNTNAGGETDVEDDVETEDDTDWFFIRWWNSFMDWLSGITGGIYDREVPEEQFRDEALITKEVVKDMSSLLHESFDDIDEAEDRIGRFDRLIAEIHPDQLTNDILELQSQLHSKLNELKLHGLEMETNLVEHEMELEKIDIPVVEGFSTGGSVLETTGNLNLGSRLRNASLAGNNIRRNAELSPDEIRMGVLQAEAEDEQKITLSPTQFETTCNDMPISQYYRSRWVGGGKNRMTPVEIASNFGYSLDDLPTELDPTAVADVLKRPVVELEGIMQNVGNCERLEKVEEIMKFVDYNKVFKQSAQNLLFQHQNCRLFDKQIPKYLKHCRAAKEIGISGVEYNRRLAMQRARRAQQSDRFSKYDGLRESLHNLRYERQRVLAESRMNNIERDERLKQINREILTNSIELSEEKRTERRTNISNTLASTKKAGRTTDELDDEILFIGKRMEDVKKDAERFKNSIADDSTDLEVIESKIKTLQQTARQLGITPSAKELDRLQKDKEKIRIRKSLNTNRKMWTQKYYEIEKRRQEIEKVRKTRKIKKAAATTERERKQLSQVTRSQLDHYVNMRNNSKKNMTQRREKVKQLKQSVMETSTKLQELIDNADIENQGQAGILTGAMSRNTTDVAGRSPL